MKRSTAAKLLPMDTVLNKRSAKCMNMGTVRSVFTDIYERTWINLRQGGQWPMNDCKLTPETRAAIEQRLGMAAPAEQLAVGDEVEVTDRARLADDHICRQSPPVGTVGTVEAITTLLDGKPYKVRFSFGCPDYFYYPAGSLRRIAPASDTPRGVNRPFTPADFALLAEAAAAQPAPTELLASLTTPEPGCLCTLCKAKRRAAPASTAQWWAACVARFEVKE